MNELTAISRHPAPQPQHRRPRLTALAGSAALFGTALLLPRPAAADAAPQTTTPTELVDAMNGLFGKQTEQRAIHAKGIVLAGTFTPAPGASALSKAPHLAGAAVPVLVRFSSFAGIPAIADNDPLASPRGMAIKFRPAGAPETDIVSHSFNGFPTATAAEFTQLLLALGHSGPGTPAPTPLDGFFATHPIAKTFLTTQPGPPVSFATLGYYGVNSFQFTNAQGVHHYGRYQIVPAAGTHLLPKDQAGAAAKDYLEQEIVRRVGAAPVRYTLQVQLAGDGDRIDDPSVAWPDARPVVVLGEIAVTRALDDSESAQRALMFTPTAVADGITPADPMISMRGAAYGVSYGRRHAP
jgi:catalase